MRIPLLGLLLLTAAIPAQAQEKAKLGIRLESKEDGRIVVYLENLTDEPLTLRDTYAEPWAFQAFLWLRAEHVDGKLGADFITLGSFNALPLEKNKPTKTIPAKGRFTLGVIGGGGGYDPILALEAGEPGERVIRLTLSADILKENQLGKSPSATIKVKLLAPGKGFKMSVEPAAAQEKARLGLRLELKEDDDGRRIVVDLENLTDKPLTLRDLYVEPWAFLAYHWLQANVDGFPQNMHGAPAKSRYAEHEKVAKPEITIPAKSRRFFREVGISTEGHPSRLELDNASIFLKPGEHVVRLTIVDDFVRENNLGNAPSAAIKIKIPLPKGAKRAQQGMSAFVCGLDLGKFLTAGCAVFAAEVAEVGPDAKYQVLKLDMWGTKKKVTLKNVSRIDAKKTPVKDIETYWYGRPSRQGDSVPGPWDSWQMEPEVGQKLILVRWTSEPFPIPDGREKPEKQVKPPTKPENGRPAHFGTPLMIWGWSGGYQPGDPALVFSGDDESVRVIQQIWQQEQRIAAVSRAGYDKEAAKGFRLLGANKSPLFAGFLTGVFDGPLSKDISASTFYLTALLGDEAIPLDGQIAIGGRIGYNSTLIAAPAFAEVAKDLFAHAAGDNRLAALGAIRALTLCSDEKDTFGLKRYVLEKQRSSLAKNYQAYLDAKIDAPNPAFEFLIGFNK